MKLTQRTVLLFFSLMIIGFACKKGEIRPIETDKNQPIQTDVEINCPELDSLPTAFIIEDPDPKNQAVSCRGLDYPDWKTSYYVLPYPIGTGYTVELNNCSSSFHAEGEPDALATDFAMPIGSCITAARAGKVVFVEESGEDFKHPNNLIIIEHLDKTFAQYMHLTKDGAAVKVGDEVQQGQFIGLSGATGLAGYPHLHFIVTLGSWDYPYQGVPITFKNTFANRRGLKSKRTYYALSHD
ncbi:MAG: M23 family metallopeptidase [Bacteroidota bacterium]